MSINIKLEVVCDTEAEYLALKEQIVGANQPIEFVADDANKKISYDGVVDAHPTQQ